MIIQHFDTYYIVRYGLFLSRYSECTLLDGLSMYKKQVDEEMVCPNASNSHRKTSDELRSKPAKPKATFYIFLPPIQTSINIFLFAATFAPSNSPSKSPLISHIPRKIPFSLPISSHGASYSTTFPLSRTSTLS